MALSPSRSPDSEATYVPLVTDGSTCQTSSNGCRQQPPNAKQDRGAVLLRESQGPGSVPSGRDAMARGLAGAYKHERCRGEGFSPFHACPAPAGAAGHARDTPLRTGGRIAKAQPIQNPVLRFALSPSVRQVQPNERRPGDTWSSLCFSTGQPRVTDPNLQSAAGAWVRPGLSGH